MKLSAPFAPFLSGVLKKWMLFFLLLTFSFLLAELFVRLFFPQSLIMQPDLWRPEPEIGWRRSPGLDIQVNTGERVTHVLTNEQGYRITRAAKNLREKPSADISILFIGDSFIEALSVEEEEAIPERLRETLEKKYPVKVEVANAGVAGWQPGQYWLESRRAFVQTRYDLGIIFFYVENDAALNLPLYFEPQQIMPRKIFRLPARWDLPSIKSDMLYPVNNYLETKSHLFVFLKDKFQIALAKIYLTPHFFSENFLIREKNSNRWELTAVVAERIAREFEQAGAAVLFVLVPTDYQVDPWIFDKYKKMFKIPDGSTDLEQPNQRLVEAFRRRSLPVLDLLPVFREETQKGRRLYGVINNHLNVEGHFVAAEALFPHVEKIFKSRRSLRGN